MCYWLIPTATVYIHTTGIAHFRTAHQISRRCTSTGGTVGAWHRAQGDTELGDLGCQSREGTIFISRKHGRKKHARIRHLLLGWNVLIWRAGGLGVTTKSMGHNNSNKAFLTISRTSQSVKINKRITYVDRCCNFSRQTDRNVIKKEAVKILKHKDLTNEIHCVWNVKAKVIPVTAAATGTISKCRLSNVPGRHEIKEIQKTAILGPVRIHCGKCWCRILCRSTKHISCAK